MHLKTRASLVLAASGAAVAAMLIPASTALAATPTLTVTLHEPTGVFAQNGDTVTAVGSGYTAGATIALVQCSTTAPDGSGCDTSPADARITTADANGGFTVNNLVVKTGTFGNGTCGAGSTCYIVAANVQTQTEAASAAFQFDRLLVTPRTNLKNGSVLNLVGGGFDPGKSIYIAQCTTLDPAKATTACDANDVKIVQSDTNGAFTTTFTVKTGTIGSDGSTCNPGQTCTLGATDNFFNPASGHVGGAIIKFAAAIKTALSAHAPTSVAAGHKFAVKGVLSAGGVGVNGATVRLYKVTSSGTKLLASKVTATNSKGVKGAYKFAGRTQSKTTRYQVKFAGGTVGGKLYAASVSKVLKVTT